MGSNDGLGDWEKNCHPLRNFPVVRLIGLDTLLLLLAFVLQLTLFCCYLMYYMFGHSIQRFGGQWQHLS